MKRNLALAVLLLTAPPLAAEFEQRLETELTLEARYFPQTRLHAGQSDQNLSLALEPEWYGEWQRGAYSVTVTPFARADSADSERSHADLREFYWQGVFGALELRAGVSRVFWGRTELLHLVDIINQDDAVENLDGEDKLGQPMLRASWATGLGSLQAYLLPWFRERTFAGADGRLRAPLPVNTDAPLYQSGAEQRHVDYALRLAGWSGGLDYGLAWFSGTQRDPQLVPAGFAPTPQGPQPTELRPFYGQVDQASLDAQYTIGSWLLKLETLWRDEGLLEPAPDGSRRLGRERYAAATGGFEYTFFGIFGTATDAGVLLEYLWDERGERGPSPFQNDVFVGTRLAANDIAGSTLLGGFVVDLDHDSLFFNLEASRRVSGGNAQIAVEYRGFSNIAPQDASFFAIRRDDYLQLEYTRYW